MTNTIIRASAGAGKTFQLSNRYLQILFRRQAVDSILASTFTRKAAGEILDRVLQRFASAALEETERVELARHVELPRPVRLVSHREGAQTDDADDEAETLRELLADLARNLYRLRIGTLDAFFNRIASAFALELGLPPGWSILDEADFERYVAEAVGRVLGESQRNDALKLMNLMQRGEQDRNVSRELVDLAMQFLPIVRETGAEAWDHAELLRTERDAVELQAVLDRYEAAEIPKNKDGSLPARFARTKEKIGLLAINGNWKGLLQETLVKNVVAGDPKFDRKEIEGDLLRSVLALIEQARAVQMNKLVGQTRATRRLLELVASAYDEILQRERGFRFDDITERLGRDDFAPTFESQNHRMDALTNHLLLDEFQDTSIVQWKIIRALAEEVASKRDGSFFCVGDVKQAIYAWRGGVAGIFDTLQKTIPEIELRSLNESYRSSPVVIETVNRLFGPIRSNEALAGHPGAVAAWRERFEEQRSAKPDLPGFCTIEVAPNADEPESDDMPGEEEGVPDQNEVFVRYVVRKIERLHRTRPGKSIGVLVARNRMIGSLIAGLKGLGIEASEEGGNPLTDSAAVRHVLSAMILADHPGDRIARFHLSRGPLAEFLRLTDFDDDRQAVDCSFRLRDALLNDGYGPVVERLAKELAPDCNPREFQRLEKLIEMAYRYQETARGIRTERFVRTVRTTRVESPTASPIRVMTVHKSKGLEFDIVVLPDLDVDLVKRPPKLIVDRAAPTSPIRFVIRYVGEELQRLLPPAYQDAFAKRIQGEVEESLSLLYVAMTRAIHELTAIVRPLKKSPMEKWARGNPVFSATFSGVLRAGLGPRQADVEPEILFQAGNPDWFRDMRTETNGTTPDGTSGADAGSEYLDCVLADKPDDWNRNLRRISPSALEETFIVQKQRDVDAEPEKEAGDVAARKTTRADAQLRGIAIHACFEHGMRDHPWLDRGTPDVATLRDAVDSAVRGKRGNVDPRQILQAFSEACEKPGIRTIHSLSTYENGESGTAVDRTPQIERPSWTVEHERRFVVRLPGNRLLRGSVDRLVVLRDGDRVVGLDIVDYKTDRPEEGEEIEGFLSGRRRIYAPQLEAYREGMARLFRLDKSRVSARLVFVELDRAVGV